MIDRYYFPAVSAHIIMAAANLLGGLALYRRTPNGIIADLENLSASGRTACTLDSRSFIPTIQYSTVITVNNC